MSIRKKKVVVEGRADNALYLGLGKVPFKRVVSVSSPLLDQKRHMAET